MRSGTSATESGNTYEQLVRTWRLADFIASTLTASEKSPAPRFVSFQHRALRPWDDIVESTPPGFVAWQVKNLVNPLPPAQLAELLLALRAEQGIHSAVLAINHVLPHSAALDLVLVDGLANASRIAQGKLPRFDRDKKEHECLVALAKLLGDLDLEDVFRTLARFDLRILHGKPDVHALTIRALHPFFEDPEGLARALLEFVVDTAAPGVQIHFDTLRDNVLPSFARRRVPWVPVPAGPPDEEVLLWHRDSRGVTRTLWLSTKDPDLVVADLPGMLLGSERNLWRWETCSVLVPFGPDDYVGFADFDLDHHGLPDESSIELLPVESARLTNVENGVIIPLGTVEGDRVGQFVLSLEHKVEPLGTFGDVFLSWARAGGESGGAHGWTMASFTALDLETGQQFQLPTKVEAEAYVAGLGDHAKRQLLDEREIASSLDRDPPAVTLCAPYYDDDNFHLHARLQFTFKTCYGDTDEAWGDYSASTMLEVDTLPSTLAPLATAPAVLRTYWSQHPKHDRCGWTRVPSSGPARERLEALVRDHHAKPHQ